MQKGDFGMTTGLLASVAAPSSDRNFKLTAPGEAPVIICDGDCINSKSLEESIKSGTGKWMYDEAAKSLGFDPRLARKNPDQHDQVMTRYSATIDRLIADQQNQTGKAASFHTAYRSNLAQVARDGTNKAANAREIPVTEGLNQKQLQQVASLPGASTLADPTARAAVQKAIDIEMKLLSASPHLQKAAQAGLAAGVVGTVALAEYLAPDAPTATDAKPTPTPESTAEPHKPENKFQLTPAAAALDLDKDGHLKCVDIGVFVIDNGRHSVNSEAYQGYVTGKPGMDFHVKTDVKENPIKFDGCKDEPAGPRLLEAKADHGNVLHPMAFSSAIDAIKAQGNSQSDAANRLGVPNEVHVQTEKDHRVIRDAYAAEKLATPIIHDPYPED
jgi:hypothetical protein